MIACAVLVRVGCSGSDANQLDHEIRPPPTPKYDVVGEGDLPDESFCHAEKLGYYPAYCLKVFTKATGEVELASINADLYASSPFAQVLGAEFYSHPYDSHSFATSYCFASKNLAASALGGALDKAELLGKIKPEEARGPGEPPNTLHSYADESPDNSACYVSVFHMSFGPTLQEAS